MWITKSWYVFSLSWNWFSTFFRDIFTNDILTKTRTVELEKPQFSFFWLSGPSKDKENEIDVDSPKKRRRKKKKRIKDRPRFHKKDRKKKRRRKKKKHRKHRKGSNRSREEIDPTLPGMEHNIPKARLRPRPPSKPQKPLEIPPLPQVSGDQRQPYG